MTDTLFPPPEPGAAKSGRGNDWRIDRDRARAGGAGAIPSEALEIVDETASTNTDLMARMKALPRERVALGVHAVRAAYRQTAGRGRQGRSWQATPGHALTFSLACVLPRPLAGLAGLSLATGVAVVDALARLAPSEAARLQLKWPNDVLLDGRKLAGILIETAWSTASASAVVIGVGINVRRDEALEADLEAAASTMPAQARGTPPAALSQALPNANLTDTLAVVVKALTEMIERFGAQGFPAFVDRWNAYHAYANREVVLIEKGNEFARGTATGVDGSGQLLLATAAGVRAIATGDVSLRLADDAS
ncbi:biotin--[acetyl-CoA-carboxylase] ligase [Trinickia dabaoshanensis]|uniref:biotin--[biotin carboxyl-carrier protein] ligase n=1 Tax=Trinickia dabaoshanensis TaxID=564714 RepID=A0A2N7VS60_9BURK|nr:biotin--[acetyl-CoA-carboxylase] ligase [Trinickia dabaoshanensis]PMS19998.1 biotin--[acetyl-CoA-carboxylase] ligase [Trinickia dabaoshanensis]